MKLRMGAMALVAEAEREIETLTVAAATAAADRDDVVIVDLRDIRERVREGFIPGSYHAPRGMLEFWVCPESPYHKPVFAEDRDFVFFCASGWPSERWIGVRPRRSGKAKLVLPSPP